MNGKSALGVSVLAMQGRQIIANRPGQQEAGVFICSRQD